MADPAFQALVDAARNGDEQAATDLVREYQSELRRYVRFHLTHPGVRRLVDSLDICQSVLASFFVSLRDGRLEAVQPRQLFRLLAVMAENKIRDKVRRFQTARRGGGVLPSAAIETVVAPAREPDPTDTAVGKELLAAIRERIRPEDCDVVERWLAGAGWAEIAASAGKKPDAVRHQVTRAVDQAARELGLVEESR